MALWLGLALDRRVYVKSCQRDGTTKRWRMPRCGTPHFQADDFLEVLGVGALAWPEAADDAEMFFLDKGFVVQDVIVGYNVSLAPIGQNQTVFVPVKASLVAFDPVTGIAQRVLADTTEGTEGILNIAPNGMIYATIGAFTLKTPSPSW